jgi:hypothetical protein
MRRHFTQPFTPAQTTTTSQLEKYVNDIGIAIDSIQLHVQAYPEDEENNQHLRDEITQLTTFRKALQRVLINRCSNTTLPIHCLMTNTYFTT